MLLVGHALFQEFMTCLCLLSLTTKRRAAHPEVIWRRPTLITEIEVWAPNKLDFELAKDEAHFVIS